MNSVQLIGRIVNDLVLKSVNGNYDICEFILAVDRTYKKNEEKKTDFIKVTCFNNIADNLCKWMSKGKKIALTGNLHTNSYENKEGKKMYGWTVAANNIEYLERSDFLSTNPVQQSENNYPSTDFNSDDMPF